MSAAPLGSGPPRGGGTIGGGETAGGADGAGTARIAATFARLHARGAAGFVPFIMAGDPDLPTTLELLRAAASAGADLIELGVPFSDPMADGPVLQRSAERALAKSTMLPGIFETVTRFRRDFDVPLILFGYTNPFFRYGTERLARDAAQSGVDGVPLRRPAARGGRRAPGSRRRGPPRAGLPAGADERRRAARLRPRARARLRLLRLDHRRRPARRRRSYATSPPWSSG